jgi:hypothetical protein
LLVLAIVVPLLALLFSRMPWGEKALTLILSLLIGHTAWHWTVERAQALRDAEWPALATGGPAALALATLALAGALAWFIRHRPAPRPVPTRTQAAGVEGNDIPP